MNISLLITAFTLSVIGCGRDVNHHYSPIEYTVERNENFVEISPLKHTYAVGDSVVIKYSIPREKIIKWLDVDEKDRLDMCSIPSYSGPKELEKYIPSTGGDIFEMAYHSKLNDKGLLHYNAKTQTYEQEYTLKWLKTNEIFNWNFLIYGLSGYIFRHLATKDGGSKHIPQFFFIKFNIRGEDYENYNKTIRVAEN